MKYIPCDMVNYAMTTCKLRLDKIYARECKYNTTIASQKIVGVDIQTNNDTVMRQNRKNKT